MAGSGELSATPPVRVLVADDHTLFREGLIEILAAEPDFAVVGEAGDGREAVAKAAALAPDIVLMDLQMPNTDGVEATRSLVHCQPQCRVVILTVRDDPQDLLAAVRAGAAGYLLKTMHSAELLRCLRGLARGEAALAPAMTGYLMQECRRLAAVPEPVPEGLPELTQREQDVLSLVAQGKSDKEVARMLSLSLYTVKAHMRSILTKLQVSGRRDAALLVRRHGVVTPPL